MGPLKVHSLLKKRDEFIVVSELLIEGIEVFEMVRVDNDMLSTKSSHVELLSSDTGEAYSLPNFWYIGSLCCIKGHLVFLKHDVNLSEFLMVTYLFKENLCSFKKFVIKASITTHLRVGLVWFFDESFELGEIFFTTLGISKDEFIINFGFFKGLSSHKQIIDDVICFILDS